MAERKFLLTHNTFNLEELSKGASCLATYMPEDMLQICPECDTELEISSPATFEDNYIMTWRASCPHCKSNWRFRLSVVEE